MAEKPNSIKAKVRRERDADHKAAQTAGLQARVDELAAKAAEKRAEGEGPWRFDADGFIKPRETPPPLEGEKWDAVREAEARRYGD